MTVQSLVQSLASKLQRNFVHLVGQAITWLVVLQHDLTKIEAAVAPVATLVGTAAVKAVAAKVAKPAQ